MYGSDDQCLERKNKCARSCEYLCYRSALRHQCHVFIKNGLHALRNSVIQGRWAVALSFDRRCSRTFTWSEWLSKKWLCEERVSRSVRLFVTRLMEALFTEDKYHGNRLDNVDHPIENNSQTMHALNIIIPLFRSRSLFYLLINYEYQHLFPRPDYFVVREMETINSNHDM